jgi:hypothetical protein
MDAAEEDNMRRQIASGLAAAATAATLALVPAPARADAIRCEIPFSFTVRGATLPPGTYTFSDESQVLLVRGDTTGALALTNRLESRSDDDAKVVFEKAGDEYVLRDVWMGGGIGRELPPPRAGGERRRPYSALSATAGSTRVALRAGSSHAIAQTANNNSGTATNVTASVAATP